MRNLVALLISLLSACAAAPGEPLLVFLTPEGYKVEQSYFGSSASLSAALMQRKAVRVDLRGVQGASYAQVQGALTAIRDAGAEVYPRIVGNVQP